MVNPIVSGIDTKRGASGGWLREAPGLRGLRRDRVPGIQPAMGTPTMRRSGDEVSAGVKVNSAGLEPRIGLAEPQTRGAEEHGP